MPDPVVTGAFLLFTGGAMRRVLGPPAEEVGKALGRVTEHRLHNLGRIAQKAEAKLGGQQGDDQAVPLRVGAKIAEDGSWCDDEVMQEYLAGVLAGSRGPGGGDDRGAYWADLVSRLARDYVRMHYLLYRALYDLGREVEGPSISLLEGQVARSIYLPMSGLASSLETIPLHAHTVANSALHVLAREALIAPTGWGSGPVVLEHFAGADEPGVQVVPSYAGIELFLWAHGIAPVTPVDIASPIPAVSDFDEYLHPVVGAKVGPLL